MPRLEKTDRGFLFLAWGDKYLLEAVSASRYLRMHNSEPICLITDQEPAASIASHFDILIVKDLQGDYSDKVQIRNSPFQLTIFLDTDILCCRPLTELFDILNHFDIAVTFTEGGNHYSIPGVPSIFHEPSAGLIAWRQSNSTAKLFDHWASWYATIEKENVFWGAWDQRSLRAALYFSDVRISPIPDRFQFYTYRPNIVEGEIAAIHGRNVSESLLKSANYTGRLRVWIPRVGFCRAPVHAPFHELIAFSMRLTFRALQLLLRRFLAYSRIWRYPVNKRPA